jgi:hypothetical protein
VGGNLFLLFAFLLPVSIASSYGKSNESKVHDYGKKTTLEGIVETRVYPGPPNYESVRNGDLAEHIWLIKLNSPINLRDDGDPTSNNEAENDIRALQLVIQWPKNERLLEQSIGHSLIITGSLFHALTGHHHLKVLMSVERCKRSK